MSKSGVELKQLNSMSLNTDVFLLRRKIRIHQHKNVYEVRTVSLNLYIKPIANCTEYNPNTTATNVKIHDGSVYFLLFLQCKP
jgi:hypothetical protein